MSLNAMNWAWEQDIPSSRKCLLLAIADCHNPSDGRCMPSVPYLMKRVGNQISRNGIQKGTQWLEKLGLITKVANQSHEGRQTSNTYLLHFHIFIRGEEPERHEIMSGVDSGIPSDIGHTGVHGGGIPESTHEGILESTTPYTPVCTVNPKVTQIKNPKRNPGENQQIEGDEGVTKTTEETTAGSPPDNPPTAKSPTKTFQYPEWWEPLTKLNGYVKRVDQERTVKTILSACEAANVSPTDVVKEFADYYTKGGQEQHGWRDPVMTLRTTIQVQVNKIVQNQFKNGKIPSPTVSVEFREEMRDRHKELNISVDELIDDALNQRKVLYVLNVEQFVEGWVKKQAGFASSRGRGHQTNTTRPKVYTDPNQYDFFGS